MQEYICFEHKLPYFSVSRTTYERKSTKGKSVFITEGECTYPLRRICPFCGEAMDIHGHSQVKLQDYELLGHLHILFVSISRMRCRCCSHTETQHIPFKAERHMLTRRLEHRVNVRINNGSTIEDAARSLFIHPAIIKQIDKEYLKSLGYLLRPHKARLIGIDEFLLHKGHRYATAVLDLTEGHVLYLEKGKKKEQAEHFIKSMGDKWMRNVEAVAMDMNAQYDSAFREHAPHVRIIYDRFHMVKMFNDSVLSALRRRKQRECRENDDKHGYELLKGSRYLLLTSPESLIGKERKARENNRLLNERYLSRGLSLPPGERIMRVGMDKHLNDLLAQNQDLNIAYILLEQFKLAYDVGTEEEMDKGLRLWYKLAEQSDVPEIISFAETIKRHEDGLLNRVKYKISNGIVEGTNNLIKTIRRKAYGFRDTEYFFLKIMFESYKPRLRYVSHKFLC